MMICPKCGGNYADGYGFDRHWSVCSRMPETRESLLVVVGLGLTKPETLKLLGVSHHWLTKLQKRFGVKVNWRARCSYVRKGQVKPVKKYSWLYPRLYKPRLGRIAQQQMGHISTCHRCKAFGLCESVVSMARWCLCERPEQWQVDLIAALPEGVKKDMVKAGVETERIAR